MKIPRKKVAETKVYRIRNQQIREPCGIKPIHEWMDRRRKGWDGHVTRIDSQRLVKISRDNVPARRFPDRPKRRWRDLSPE